MQRLTLFMIIVVTTFDFLANGDKFGNGQILPGFASYFSELMGACAIAYVVIVGTRDRFQFVRPAYWIAFGSLLLVIVLGIVVNDVESGPILAGMRAYLRAVPWFFVPAVYAYSEDQLKSQMRLLLAICAIQVPLAIRQRIQTMDNSWGFVAVTGDWTVGTMMDAGILCIFLVGAICILAAMFERKLLSPGRFLLLFFVLLVPTMINETKAMVIFLPVALLVAFVNAAHPSVRLKKVLTGILVLVMFGAVFVPVYDALNKDRKYGSSIGDFFSDEKSVETYLSSNSEIGSDKEPGRGDAITVPLGALAKDPALLTFGYGIGNASDSSLGLQYGGKQAATFRPFMQTSFAKFVLELGLSGVTILFGVYWLIFRDSQAVARSDDGLNGAIAAGWTGVVALMSISMFYNKGEVFPSLSFMFWYFSGLIAAARMRMLAAQHSSVLEMHSRRHHASGRVVTS